MPKIAVVRVRGIRNMKPLLLHALRFIRLNQPNHCVLLDDSPSTRGVLNRLKDYITFGSIQEKTLFALLHKRGEVGGKWLREVKSKADIEKLARDGSTAPHLDGVDPVFRLHPPRKGYKNLKLAYPNGALGPRPEMDTLLKRMM